MIVTRLTQSEAEVLDKIATITKMNCWFHIGEFGDGCNYIEDLEDGITYGLREGIQLLYEGMAAIKYVSLTSHDIDVFETLLEKLGIEHKINLEPTHSEICDNHYFINIPTPDIVHSQACRRVRTKACNIYCPEDSYWVEYVIEDDYYDCNNCRKIHLKPLDDRFPKLTYNQSRFIHDVKNGYIIKKTNPNIDTAIVRFDAGQDYIIVTCVVADGKKILTNRELVPEYATIVTRGRNVTKYKMF